jgi:hypothetical protein
MLFCLLLLAARAGFCARGPAGANILGLIPDARTTAMGETFCAIADDINAVYYNPAGLAGITHTEIPAVNNIKLLNGVNLQSVGLALSLRDVRASNLEDLGTAALTQSRLDYGDIQGRDENGASTGLLTASDQVTVVSYGRCLYRDEGAGNIMAGINAKNVLEKTTFSSYRNTVYDAGLLWALPFANICAGIVSQNCGGKMNYGTDSFNPPRNIKCGVSWKKPGFTAGLDVNLPYGADPAYSFGVEYLSMNSLFLRAGYNSARNGAFSAGFGISVKEMDVLFWYLRELTFDYAFLPSSDLGDVHRISVTFKIGAD